MNVLQPYTLFGDRVNQIDLRFGKLLRFNGTKTLAAVSIAYACLSFFKIRSFRRTSHE